MDETNLLEAIEKIKKGASVQEVVLNFSERDRQEAEEILLTANSLLTLPKNPVPEPAMQRKFMIAPVKHFWLSWLPISRMATASLSVILLVTALAGTGYAALKSTPGQTLFSVKKSAEHLRMKLALSQEAKVNLQVEIAKQRLSEAQQIFQNPNSNPKQEEAALKELMAETKNTIEAVDTATKANPKPAQNHPLIASLEDITQQQQELLNQIEPKEELTDTAKIALETTQENANKVNQIKKFLLAAADEQSLADLDSDPNTVTISGNISAYTKNSITIEKTSFSLNGETVIKNTDGSTTGSSTLSTGLKVRVKGTKDKDKITANQIIVIENIAEAVPEVKGSSTPATAISTSTPSTSTSSPKTATPASTSSAGTMLQPKQGAEEAPAPDPNTATGAFIPEDPSPHSAF